LAKTFLDEDRSEELRAWLDKAIAARETLLAPPLACSEVGRIIQREMGLPPEESAKLHDAVFIGVEVVAPAAFTDPWRQVRPGITFYDAEYLALAAERKATLATADRAQLEGARKAGLAARSFVPGVK